MGWDAYSSAYGKTDRDSKNALIAFRKASNKIIEEHDSYVDNLLAIGGLDLSGCRNLIQNITTLGCYNDVKASKLIKEYNKIDWTFIDDLEDEQALLYAYSVKYFLKVCIRYGLSLTFSY